MYLELSWVNELNFTNIARKAFSCIIKMDSNVGPADPALFLRPWKDRERERQRQKEGICQLGGGGGGGGVERRVGVFHLPL
jgi:hypothetical protein